MKRFVQCVVCKLFYLIFTERKDKRGKARGVCQTGREEQRHTHNHAQVGANPDNV